jgi:hypothetical protein
LKALEAAVTQLQQLALDKDDKKKKDKDKGKRRKKSRKKSKKSKRRRRNPRDPAVPEAAPQGQADPGQEAPPRPAAQVRARASR